MSSIDLPLRKLDGHVHMIGDGSSGSGCRIFIRGLWRRLQGMALLRCCGIETRYLRGGLDEAYVERLIDYIRTSNLDGALVLAMDYPHDIDGNPLIERAAFYTPNDYVLNLANEFPEFIPAVSIHPYRRDALQELERCVAAGAKVVKLLPNVHNVDPDTSAARRFWSAMAENKLILLAHTGGEVALPVMNSKFANPRLLRPVLELGVRVIAAHCGSRGHPFDRDYTSDWVEMLQTYPNLYGDISALGTPDRARTLRIVRDSAFIERLIHGSDYPIPAMTCGPILRGLISWRTALKLRRIKNPLERDRCIKTAVGFPESVFTRLDKLLREN